MGGRRLALRDHAQDEAFRPLLHEMGATMPGHVAEAHGDELPVVLLPPVGTDAAVHAPATQVPEGGKEPRIGMWV